MEAESPASVTTHGTPHAIASPTTLGKLSAKDDDTETSNAAVTLAMSARSPRRWTRSLVESC
jgi:hypothetical protein